MQRPLHTAGPESPTCKITAATRPHTAAAGTIRFSEESRALLDDDRKPRGRYFTAQRRRTPLWALVLFGVAGTLTLFVVCRFFSAMLGGGHREAAFAMSLGAGMSTGIGAAFVLVTTSLDRRLLAATLSFSAGVMLYVSLVEVIGVADEYFAKGDGVRADVAYFHATLSFFAGVAIMAVVDKLVHLVFDAVAGGGGGGHGHGGDRKGAHAPVGGGGGGGVGGGSEDGLSLADAEAGQFLEEEDAAAILRVAGIQESRRLLMMASVVAAAIVLHNIPEGMATFVASYHSVASGLPLAVAIAIHNIPEGLAVAMPVYHGTGSKAKAVALGTLSGFSEPFGALLASLVATEDSTPGVFGGMFGLTAGMMCFVCINELLPAAYAERGVSRTAVTAAFFAGCAVMAASLVVEKWALAPAVLPAAEKTRHPH